MRKLILQAVLTGFVILNLAAVATLRAADHQELTSAQHQAVATLLREAAAHVEQRAFDAAAAALERALRIDPRDANIWRLLAQVKRQQGDEAQADSMMAKADSLDAKKAHPATKTAPPAVAGGGSQTTPTKKPARTRSAAKTDRPRPENKATAKRPDPAWQRALARSKQALAEVLEDHDALQRDAELAVLVEQQAYQIEQLIEQLRAANSEREQLLDALRARTAPARRGQRREELIPVQYWPTPVYY